MEGRSAFEPSGSTFGRRGLPLDRVGPPLEGGVCLWTKSVYLWKEGSAFGPSGSTFGRRGLPLDRVGLPLEGGVCLCREGVCL